MTKLVSTASRMAAEKRNVTFVSSSDQEASLRDGMKFGARAF